MEPLRVCTGRPVVADSHHYDAEQDPDPDCIKVKIRIRIQTKKKKHICNPGQQGCGSGSLLDPDPGGQK
jgi:hypothetical protein